MATVTRSAADSAVRLLNTVAAAADSASTIISASGAAFGVLDVKAQSWLKATREEITDIETTRSVVAASSNARVLVDHAEELEIYLGGNAKRKAAYEACLATILEARQKAAA